MYFETLKCVFLPELLKPSKLPKEGTWSSPVRQKHPTEGSVCQCGLERKMRLGFYVFGENGELETY